MSTWSQPRPGDVIGGRYRVEALLGEGGVAVVLAATHEVLRQRVAVKILQPHFAPSEQLRERFFREGRALAALRGNHVARVFDVGVLPGGFPYLVLEHLDGLDLRQLVERDGPIPWPRAVRYVTEACEGLCEAHQLGIWHRDLKPSNLFLSADPSGKGVVKILDFGLAKLTEEGSSSLTEAGAVMGTPAYMSPEQIKGLSSTDARSDVWSLGVTLFELLSSRLPFEDTNATKTAHVVLASPPASVRTPGIELPVGLEEVVNACLVKDPAARIQSAENLLARLRPYATSSDPEPNVILTAGPSAPTQRTAALSPRDQTYGGMLPNTPLESGTIDRQTIVEEEEESTLVKRRS
jgi:eukaryotic-like serine/threonine-protein kinase